MIEAEKNTFDDLINDFLHPNPDINMDASIKLRDYYPEQFKEVLIKNLKSDDIIIRRKSILALGIFKPDLINNIVDLYFAHKDENIKVSCIKVLIKILVNNNLNNVSQNVIDLIKDAMNQDSCVIILTVISLLKLISPQGIDLILEASKDNNPLKANAAITVLEEIKMT